MIYLSYIKELQSQNSVAKIMISTIVEMLLFGCNFKNRPLRTIDQNYYLCIMNIVDRNIENINDLCKKHKVSKLFAFGSVLTNRFKKTSDIDFIVDFQGVDLYNYADNYFDLKESLERLFNREVDLLEDKAIKNPYLRHSIDSSKQLIYG